MRWLHNFLWSLLKAKIKIINVTSLHKVFFFWWYLYCATQAGEKQTHTVKNTGIYTSVTSCPITHVSLVKHSRLTLPQAMHRLPPLIWAQHAAVMHAGALWGAPYTPPPPTSWKDQPMERESCPTAGSLPDEEELPSHLPLHWPALQPGQRQWGCPWKALDLLYHPLFTNNVSWLSNGDKAVPLCGSPFWLCWYKILLKSMRKL